MNKTRFLILCSLLFILLIACEEEKFPRSLRCGFITSELTVEVTEKTKSFRIEMEWPTEDANSVYSLVEPDAFLDEETTTAKHKFHFVNTPDEFGRIGAFVSLLEERKAYKNVTIIPGNITEDVVIVYNSIYRRSEREPIEYGELFNQLKVILRPKDSEQ